MKVKTLLTTTLIIVLLFVSNMYVVAYEGRHIGGEDEDTLEEYAEDRGDLLDRIKEYEKKLDELESREKSLQNEIAYAENQLGLTELRIQNSIEDIARKEKEIKKLGEDIEDLKGRIVRLEDSIGFQQQIMNGRLRARYKIVDVPPIVVIFGSSTLSTLVKKSEYLKVMQIQDKKLLDQMTDTKDDYGVQKDIYEDKKEEKEILKQQLEAEKAQLEVYKVELENLRKQKEHLLKLTQNDETKFQKLLEDAKKELQQIIGAASALQDHKPREVDKGDVIGIQGNTGYSFGDHLHFGVYKYDSIKDIAGGWDWYHSNSVNPAKRLKSKTVYWNTGCESSGDEKVGSGKWRWPMDSPTVSQSYGYTCYSNTYYGGAIHPAYDMYGSVGALIYAVDDGDAYFCRNCLGDGGNGVFIFHDDGYMTLYWHLQ